MPGIPSLDEIRAWTQAARTSVTDAQLQQVVDAELANQARACRAAPPVEGDPPPTPDDYPAVLAQALYRRVARELAGRQVPLGVVGDPASEYGASRLSSFDAEVERLEGPYRMVVFG